MSGDQEQRGKQSAHHNTHSLSLLTPTNRVLSASTNPSLVPQVYHSRACGTERLLRVDKKGTRSNTECEVKKISRHTSQSLV